MTKSEKKKRLSQIVERLKEIYPDAECAPSVRDITRAKMVREILSEVI